MDVILPDFPDGLFPLKQLGKQLSIEVARLKSKCKGLKIDVTSIDGISYIPREAVAILEKAVGAKNTSGSGGYETSVTTRVIPAPKVKTVPRQAPTDATALVVSGEGAGASPEAFLLALAKVMEQRQASAPHQSPLTIQRELKEAADNGFLVSSEQVSNILGMKKSTLSSWKSGVCRYGFRFIKVKEGNTTLWRVEQY